MNEAIDTMLAARTFAVVGASNHPEKYGNIIYHDLKRHGKTVWPVNPGSATIDGDPCYPNVAALPEKPEVVVAVIPPAATEKLVDEVAAAGIRHLWIQPGAESPAVLEKALRAGLHVVGGGPCILVGLRTHSVT
ncbi:MAG: CoA-binding protein [Capsulimonadales bacterium]|nr:CoA-binding protein [Capsulimonadales bacterium]